MSGAHMPTAANDAGSHASASGQLPPSIPVAVMRRADTELRVRLTEVDGAWKVCLRIFTPYTRNGVRMPAKNGFRIKLTDLLSLIETLQRAEARARRLGLNTGGGS